MILRGIDFGNILCASGVQGFFGEGYWFHGLFRVVGLNFKGMTFVSKTCTSQFHRGNAPLTQDYQLREWFPKCVKIKFWEGLMLNAVGLSNPGIGALLATKKWQARTEPFFISIATVGATTQTRLDEIRSIVELLGCYRDQFHAPFGLQINVSCPNTGHNLAAMSDEVSAMLDIASQLNVPLMPKYSVASAATQAMISHLYCDAICVSNTIPYHWLNFGSRIWGKDVSPIERYGFGGGGISGKPLLPLVCNWIKILREIGFEKPIVGGGGILCKRDVDKYKEAGSNAVSLGSVASLRPWRVRGVIRYAKGLRWSI